MQIDLVCNMLERRKLYSGTRQARAVMGRASETRRSAMREIVVVLRFRLTSTAPPLY